MGNDFEGGGNGVGVYDEGVIAGGEKGARDSRKDSVVVVVYGGGFAVHEPLGTDNFRPKVLSDCLVTETDSEKGYFAREMVDDVQANACLVGGAGAG